MKLLHLLPASQLGQHARIVGQRHENLHNKSKPTCSMMWACTPGVAIAVVASTLR